jgi:hypothetical protein
MDNALPAHALPRPYFWAASTVKAVVFDVDDFIDFAHLKIISSQVPYFLNGEWWRIPTNDFMNIMQSMLIKRIEMTLRFYGYAPNGKKGPESPNVVILSSNVFIHPLMANFTANRRVHFVMPDKGNLYSNMVRRHEAKPSSKWLGWYRLNFERQYAEDARTFMYFRNAVRCSDFTDEWWAQGLNLIFAPSCAGKTTFMLAYYRMFFTPFAIPNIERRGLKRKRDERDE